jgi:hypothetical protein
MKRDQQLVSLFLDEYKKISGEGYQVKEWVDDTERNKPAIEAIAVNDSTGKSLAIEHTLLQPFEGEKNDTQRFLAAIGDLEKDDSIKLPKYLVDISFQVDAIPKGVNWSDVNNTLRDWVRNNLANLRDGESKETLRHDALEIELGVSKMTLEHNEKGMLLFSRCTPPDSLPEVMKIALRKKLPKLVGTEADKRILLLEKDGYFQGNGTIHGVLEKLAPDFDELKKVDEIWLIGTAGWESHDYLSFTRIWPNIATWVNGNLQ